MYINKLFSSTISYHQVAQFFSKQDKLKIIVASIALAILLGGAIWSCSFCWKKRKITSDTQPPQPDLASKILDPKKNSAPTGESPKDNVTRTGQDQQTDVNNSGKEPKEPPKIVRPEEKPSEPTAVKQPSANTSEPPADKQPDANTSEPSAVEQPDENPNDIHDDKQPQEKSGSDDLQTQLATEQQIMSSLTPDQKLSIYISSASLTGCVGNDPSMIPHISDFKLKNMPLPLLPDDLLLAIDIFNLPDNSTIPPTLYLPAILFAGKREGETLRLFYKNQLIEFILRQDFIFNDSKFIHDVGSFEEVFQRTFKEAQDKILDHLPMFGKFDPYHWYKLDNGTIYKPVYSGGDDSLKLKEVGDDQFRPLQKTAIVLDPFKSANHHDNKIASKKPKNILNELPFSILKKPEGWYILAELPGFQADSAKDQQSMEFILNERRLILHVLRSEYELRPMVDASGSTKTIFPLKPIEYVKGIIWSKYFKDFTLDQMKAQFEKSTLLLKDGTFQIFIPDPNSTQKGNQVSSG